MNASLKSLVILAVLACGACSKAAEPVDPTSAEALRKAPSLQWGTTCNKHSSSSYGTAYQSETKVVCNNNSDCGDTRPSESAAYLGGATYESLTTYTRQGFFKGTCDKQTAVTCEGRPQNDACSACEYTQCCGQLVLCEDDPNCMAIVECVTETCNNDDACAAKCWSNGEFQAQKMLRAALKCIQKDCADACTTNAE